ncbi:MAG: polysaccharide biosynthesis/export family protein [Candidatus Acidiferrales bacterium]
MIATVQGLLDCFRTKPIWFLPVLLWGIQAGYCQEKFETPKQTNDKIFQMAEVNKNRPVEMTIGSGDVLHIDVFDIPELSRDVRVGDTGDISLPLIPGRVHVAGLTTFELEAKLEDLLVENGLVTHPQVSIFVKEQISQPVSVVGAVGHPSVYQIVRPTTLIEILANAGGITDDAGAFVMVTRGALYAQPVLPPTPPPPNGGGQDPPEANGPTTTVRLRDLLVSGDPTFNLEVYGGDAISVPKSGIVYVMGAVAQPGGYVLESRGDHITAMKAVTMAHGFTGTAKANSAVILRQDPKTGVKTEIPCPLKKILARKVDDIPLQAGDEIYVPDSPGKRALARAGEAAVFVGTAAAIYRIQ